MQSVGRLALCGLALAAGSVAALAQSAVISARSGLIHHVEGQVYVGDQLVESKFGNFPEVKENQQLRTEEGRAEVLLTPGAFLRLGENSSFRMVTNRLIDTRLEFLSGSAIVEVADVQKDNSITVVYGNVSVHIVKKGLFRFDSSPAELRVFDGIAEASSGDRTVEVKEGRLLALDSLDTHKFDKTATDALDRWSERRAEYVSMANVSAANSIRNSMYGGNAYGGMYGDSLYNGLYGGGFYGRTGMFMGGWYFNPYFGMYTFVPGMGMGYSPYGFAFWSPFSVYQAYMPGYYYNPGYMGGYRGAYNTATRSVPAPARSGGVIGSGRGSSPVAMGHGSVVRGSSGAGTTGRGSAGSTGTVSAGRSSGSGGGMSAPISRGGGIGNSPHR